MPLMSDMISLDTSVGLQNNIEYCIKVRKTGPTDMKPNWLDTFRRKITINDMQMSAAIYEFSDGARFAWSHQLVGFLLSVINGFCRKAVNFSRNAEKSTSPVSFRCIFYAPILMLLASLLHGISTVSVSSNFFLFDKQVNCNFKHLHLG